LRARALAEHTHLEQVEQLSAARTWAAAWQPDPPTGGAALRALAGGHPRRANGRPIEPSWPKLRPHGRSSPVTARC
jgi:hypothetical protein